MAVTKTNLLFLFCFNKSKDILKDTGRIIVRPSGTEPLIRVMIEGNDLDLINQLLNDIAHVIENKIGIK